MEQGAWFNRPSHSEFESRRLLHGRVAKLVRRLPSKLGIHGFESRHGLLTLSEYSGRTTDVNGWPLKSVL